MVLYHYNKIINRGIDEKEPDFSCFNAYSSYYAPYGSHPEPQSERLHKPNQAEVKSFKALYAALDESREEIQWEQLKLPYLPSIEYTAQVKDYYNDIPETATLNHQITLRQRIIDSSLLDIMEQEKNRPLVLEITKLEVRNFIKTNVRSLYYGILLHQEEIKRLEELLNFFKVPGDSPLLNAAKKQQAEDIKEDILQVKLNILSKTDALLDYIQKPRDSKVILTTGLPTLTINKEKDKEKALENNIYLKYRILDMKRSQGDLERSALDYLPKLSVDLNQRINDQATVGLSADFNGSRNFNLDLLGAYQFEEKVFYYDPANDPALPAVTPPPIEDSLDYTISLEYNLNTLFTNDNKRKQYQNSVDRNEVDIKKQTASIIATVEAKENTLNLLKERVEINFGQLEAVRGLLQEVDKSLQVNTLQELNYYQGELSALVSRMNDVNTRYSILYQEFMDYLDFLDG